MVMGTARTSDNTYFPHGQYRGPVKSRELNENKNGKNPRARMNEGRSTSVERNSLKFDS